MRKIEPHERIVVNISEDDKFVPFVSDGTPSKTETILQLDETELQDLREAGVISPE